MVENTLQEIKREIEKGKKQNILNGDVSSKTDGTLQAKFGGACVEYYDFDKNVIRVPTQEDVINMIRLGENIPEVKLVGNPVMCLEEEGKPIHPKMQRIKTAAVVAKNTSKPGSTEVWNQEELEFLVEIGIVVRGSLEAYRKNPCFITAKETTSPLVLEREAGEVLVALAKKDLPCTIIPMPIAGITGPVTSPGNVVIANAEILGTMVAIRSVVPEAIVAGGVMSGVMDMRTGGASFSAPEAIFQDLLLSELHESLYGFDFGIGTGCIDAKYPGIQAVMEKELKIVTSALSGRTNYPVGLLVGAKRFCPESAILDLEIAKYVHRVLNGLSVDRENLGIDTILSVGPGGSFIEKDHTYRNFRKAIWDTDIMDRTMPTKLDEDKLKDMLFAANRKWKQILKEKDPYFLSKEQEKEINHIVKKAEQKFLG